MSGAEDKPAPHARAAEEFVHKVLSPKEPLGDFRELGTTALARQLGLPEKQLGGHWCSRCRGIWYGCLLEVQCPACGNRSG